MKKIKQAFTIVELVIVIAVIAILAAVLIPTFSNVIRKANLSADKQAVREMNMALAAYDAANGYGKVHTVEDAMQVLANAGYNSENWVCLTAGYQVYWYEKDNRCILYNSTTAEVEYPAEYDTKLMLKASDKLHIYNENHVKAQQFAMSLNSNTASVSDDGKGVADFSSVTSITTINGVVIESGSGNSHAQENLTQLSSASAQNIIKSALGASSTENVYIHATKEEVSSSVTNSAYASLQIASISAEESEVILKSNGEISENLFYITIVPGTDDLGMAEAKKAAAQYLYNIFDQITTGKLDNSVTIIVEPDTTLDCSGYEWAPCKSFQGYFGSPDPEHPLIIDGATLSTKTGYSQTIQFVGSQTKDSNGNPIGNSYYFVTGFFGTVYGSTTIENVVFRNLNIDKPATDYAITVNNQSRNCIGVIGGIINTGDINKAKLETIEADVLIKNVKVENTNITGQATVGGLIGYIGGAGESNFYGNVRIEEVTMDVNLKSLDSKTATNYSPVGGLIGLTGRVSSNKLKVELNNIKVSGTFDGYNNAAGILGNSVCNNIEFVLDGKIDLSEITYGSTISNVYGVATFTNGNVGVSDSIFKKTSTCTLSTNIAKDMGWTDSGVEKDFRNISIIIEQGE